MRLHMCNAYMYPALARLWLLLNCHSPCTVKPLLIMSNSMGQENDLELSGISI